MQVQVPEATYPEYRCTLVWRADADGQFVRVYLSHHVPGQEPQHLQSSAHPNTNLLEVLESALTEFFERRTNP